MGRIRSLLAFAADAVTLLAVGVGLIGAAVGGYVALLHSVGLAWAILAAIGAFFVLAAGVRSLVGLLVRRTATIGEESYFAEKRIRLTDLVFPGDPVVRDKTFVRCRFIGPAVVCFLDGNVVQGGFERDQRGGWDSILFEVAEGRVILGPIGFQRCTFRECRFNWVGIMGTPKDIQNLREAIARFEAQQAAKP